MCKRWYFDFNSGALDTSIMCESRFAYSVTMFSRAVRYSQCNRATCPPHRGSRRHGTRSLPVPPCPRRKGEKERKMRILRLRRARADHKVSSAEMHVKRFKRAPEVSFALSFPSHPTRSSFPLLLSPSLVVESIFSTAPVAAFSRARRARLGCILLRFETSHGRDSSLFAYLPYTYPPASGNPPNPPRCGKR